MKRIVDHGSHVYTVDLIPERKVPLFRPGQFLHLALDEYDPSSFWPESRVFSVASSPIDRSSLRICYSVKGRYTTRMERELEEGGSVWVKLPYGDFVVDVKKETLLLAGGTGFTAFSAFLQTIKPPAYPLHILYGARTESLLVFGDLVRQKCRESPMLDAVFFCEQADEAFWKANAPNDGVRHELGLINIDTIWPRLTDPLDVDCYVAGPPAMIETFTLELRQRDVPASSILIDAW